MRFKWLQSKLTFIMIQDTNAGLIRVKISRAALSAVICSSLLLLGAAAYVYVHHFHSVAASQWIEAQLTDQTDRLRQDLVNKDSTIEQLQNEILQLSRQADEVRSKVEEMKALKQELTKLLPSNEAAPQDTPVAAAAQAAATGMGGPSYPVTAQQIKSLSSQASASYLFIKQELNELQSEWTESKQALLVKREQLQRIPNIWPTRSRTVSSPFGYRKDPFTEKLSFHRGIDIAGKINDPVVAAAKGNVMTVGFDPFHGHHIILEHGDGLRTWYMHLNRTLVQRGDYVECGQQIGRLGSSGRSTGPHLHYEVVHHGKSTDPKPYLP
jgi:murein DD-endopeptidase MepM/ murein hydrolase activator NlpD